MNIHSFLGQKGEIFLKKLSYIEDFNQWVQDFEFYQTFKVRFSETDMFGHLNNTVPFVYFESARIEYLNHYGFMQEWSTSGGSMPIVADLQCDFLKQVFFGDEVKVYVKIFWVGNSSIDLHYLGVNKAGDYVFTGRGVLVNLDLTTGKGKPWTDEEKQRFVEAK